MFPSYLLQKPIRHSLISRLKTAYTQLVVCSVMFLVIGCAVGPDYRTPKVSAPESWSASQQNETINSADPVVHWWKTFNDPLLDSLIIRAMKSNLDLRVAEARIREARFLNSAVSAELWPEVNTSALYSRSRRSLGISTIPPSAKLKRNLYQAGFDAIWEIDLFGWKRRAREAARADVDAAVENQRDVLITLLAELTKEMPIPSVSVTVSVGLPSDLLRRRPDVRRIERELAAATARIGVATADLFPKFSLTGDFGLQSEGWSAFSLINSRYWSFGPTMRWPIFEAGRIRANIHAQNARQEQILFNYEKSILSALEDVENALAVYTGEQVRHENLAEAVNANRRAVELASELFTRGLANFLYVLDAERSLYESEDNLAQSEHTVSLNLVSLYKALGGGWEKETS